MIIAHTIFKDEREALTAAEANTADDEDGWSYAVSVGLQSRMAIVNVYDEYGEFIAYL